MTDKHTETFSPVASLARGGEVQRGLRTSPIVMIYNQGRSGARLRAPLLHANELWKLTSAIIGLSPHNRASFWPGPEGAREKSESALCRCWNGVTFEKPLQDKGGRASCRLPSIRGGLERVSSGNSQATPAVGPSSVPWPHKDQQHPRAPAPPGGATRH